MTCINMKRINSQSNKYVNCIRLPLINVFIKHEKYSFKIAYFRKEDSDEVGG